MKFWKDQGTKDGIQNSMKAIVAQKLRTQIFVDWGNMDRSTKQYRKQVGFSPDIIYDTIIKVCLGEGFTRPEDYKSNQVCLSEVWIGVASLK